MLSPKLDFVASFNPRQLAGLALWLDAADVGTLFQNQGGTTPVTADGNPVFRWNDKSGNGRNATTPRVISQISRTTGGSGYTLAPVVTITAAGVDIGSGAQATATISGGAVSALTLTARGSQYGQPPTVTITPAAGDTTGTGATATATATTFPVWSSAARGVRFNNLNTGTSFTTGGPYMALPALSIPDNHTVFGVVTRVDGQYSLPIGSGFDTPSIGAPQGSRYANGIFTDNIVYATSVSQGSYTTHLPQRGFDGQVVIVRSVRTAGTSVVTRVNNLPESSVTTGTGVTQSAAGSWGAIGADVASTTDPAVGNQILRIHRGLLHEVIVYDRVLTQEELATVAEYLRAKWVISPAWTPAHLPNLTAWFDASDATTISLTALDNPTVSQWRDKSGFNRHASQGTATSRPTYNASGLNGKGSIECFTGSKLLATAAGIPYDYDNCSAYAVASMEAVNYSEMLFQLADHSTASVADIFALRRSGTAGTQNVLQVNSADVAGSVIPATDAIIGGIYSRGVRRDARINGTQTTGSVTSTRTGVSANSVLQLLGPSEFLQGRMSEFVLTNSALSTSDAEKLEGYLAHKWGLAGSLPANHQYKASPP